MELTLQQLSVIIASVGVAGTVIIIIQNYFSSKNWTLSRIIIWLRKNLQSGK